MKTIRLYAILFLLLAGAFVSAQSVSLTITGRVLTIPNNSPWANHQVYIRAYPDTTNPESFISATIYTQTDGSFSTNMNIPSPQEGGFPFTVSTRNCKNSLDQHYLRYSEGVTNYSTDFLVCDSVPTGGSCGNYMNISKFDDLDWRFYGFLYDLGDAEFYWDFDDGTRATGLFALHHFPGYGSYNVVLHSVTQEGCSAVSEYILTILDTTTTSRCYNTISPAYTGGMGVSFHSLAGNMDNSVPHTYTYHWDFGDGSTAITQNTIHNYPGPGFYLVSLTTTSEDNCSALSQQIIHVSDTIAPDICAYHMTILTQPKGRVVEMEGGFVDPVNATYYWDFGDGHSSDLPVTSHTYDLPGSYIVTFSCTSGTSCTVQSTRQINIYDMGDCQNYILVNNVNALTVTLQAEVGMGGDNISYFWDFGDNITNYNYTQFVSHTYSYTGFYLVKLTTVTSDNCTSTSYFPLYLVDTTSAENCDSYLTFTNIVGHTVYLNGSMDIPQEASYEWQFGDGADGSGVSISHTYIHEGTCSVGLKTTTPFNCTHYTLAYFNLYDSVTFSSCRNYFVINGAGMNSVSLTGEMMIPQPASYFWSFGDGNTATTKEVTHHYSNDGTYLISLTTITPDNCRYTSSVLIVTSDTIPDCNSYFVAQAGSSVYNIHFHGSTQSSYPTNFSWNFGDFSTGTGQNIEHTYQLPGTYTVTLSTIDTSGCTSSYSNSITIGDWGASYIRGHVYADNQPITACRVQLFSQDLLGNSTMVKETTPDSANFYRFSLVQPGLYHILGIPEAGTYSGQFVPTYYSQAFLWDDATAILLGYAENPYEIHLIAYDSVPGGNGSVGGSINTGGKATLLANQEVLLLNDSGEPVRCTFTDAQGNYLFSALPYGNYVVYPNITGITTIPVAVNLDASSPVATVNMAVKGNKITGISDLNTGLITLDLFPNPATSLLYIKFQNHKDRIHQIEILDTQGRVVFKEGFNPGLDKDIYKADVSGLEKGVYFLHLSGESGNITIRKFLKI